MSKQLLSIAAAAVAALVAACSGGAHPRPMREAGVVVASPNTSAGASGGAGGGAADNANAGGGGTASPPPVARPSRQTSDCESLGQCCAGLVGDDEAACLAVLQAHDEPFCGEGVQRFCWNVQVCDVEGCSSHRGAPGP